MIGRKVYFDFIRRAPFPGKLTTEQVSGNEAIISEYEKRTVVDLRWLAYMLATTYHETAFTMQPIHERGPIGYFNKYDAGTPIGNRLGNTVKGDGYLFRGRGYVQLTGRANYTRMSDIIGQNLVTNPDLALKPGIASAIMFEGMTRGLFTGKKLSDYINNLTTDWVQARRIINGTDRAETIAGYAKQFHSALLAASLAIEGPSPVVATKPPPPPDITPTPPPAEKGFWSKFGDLFQPPKDRS